MSPSLPMLTLFRSHFLSLRMPESDGKCDRNGTSTGGAARNQAHPDLG